MARELFDAARLGKFDEAAAEAKTVGCGKDRSAVLIGDGYRVGPGVPGRSAGGEA